MILLSLTSKNNETFDPYRLVLNLVDKLNSKSDKYLAL